MLEPKNIAQMVRNFLLKKPSIEDVTLDKTTLVCRGKGETIIITVERQVP